MVSRSRRMARAWRNSADDGHMLADVLLYLRCPACAADLTHAPQVLRCRAGHVFDIARHGYVNLLTGKVAFKGDAPLSTILKQIKEAAKLNDDGVKAPPQRKAKEKAPLVVPPYFKKALKANPAALATFAGFTYSHKKEYLEWITEAKTEETRQRRLAQTLEWLAEGKSRNWKYERC